MSRTYSLVTSVPRAAFSVSIRGASREPWLTTLVRTHSKPLTAFFFLRENTIAFVSIGSQAKSLRTACIFSLGAMLDSSRQTFLKAGDRLLYDVEMCPPP